MTEPSGTLNGFDLDVIGTLQGCIREDAERAHPRYGATIRWLGGQRSESRLAGGSRLLADEPVECAGTASAPTPEDYLLSAVGSCLAAAWVGALTTRGIAIRSLEIDVAGRVNFAGAYLLDGTPPGFESIEIDVRLDAEADPAALEELSGEVLRMSIIPDTIARPVPVSMRLATGAERHVSTSTSSERTRALQASGVIEGCHASVAMDALGRHVQALIAVIDRLTERPEVADVNTSVV